MRRYPEARVWLKEQWYAACPVCDVEVHADSFMRGQPAVDEVRQLFDEHFTAEHPDCAAGEHKFLIGEHGTCQRCGFVWSREKEKEEES